MTTYIGIDPGKLGAIAVIDDGGARIYPMPLIPSGKKGRDEYDLIAIGELVRGWARRDAFVTVEKLQPMPLKHGGTIANYNRGIAAGWAWVLAALGVSHQLVSPQRWQGKMHEGTPAGDTKQRSIIAAQRLFPLVELKASARCRVPSDGFAEALLIAEYGRRTHAGALVAAPQQIPEAAVR